MMRCYLEVCHDLLLNPIQVICDCAFNKLCGEQDPKAKLTRGFGGPDHTNEQ